MIDDTATHARHADLPTQLTPPIDYPATPDLAWSAAQDELATLQIPLWRNPWTRVWGLTATSLCAVAVAAYLAGVAHPRIVTEHTPPITKTVTVTVPQPPDNAKYLTALHNHGITFAIGNPAVIDVAYKICDLAWQGSTTSELTTALDEDNSLNPENAVFVINTAESMYCPHPGQGS